MSCDQGFISYYLHQNRDLYRICHLYGAHILCIDGGQCINCYHMPALLSIPTFRGVSFLYPITPGERQPQGECPFLFIRDISCKCLVTRTRYHLGSQHRRGPPAQPTSKICAWGIPKLLMSFSSSLKEY